VMLRRARDSEGATGWRRDAVGEGLGAGRDAGDGEIRSS